MSSPKWRQICLGLNVLRNITEEHCNRVNQLNEPLEYTLRSNFEIPDMPCAHFVCD